MKPGLLLLGATLLVGVGLSSPSLARESGPGTASPQFLIEQKHFVDCLAYLYTPAFWLSYNQALFFAPRTSLQVQQIQEMKTARSNYLALTNPATRHEIAAKVIAESGIAESWQRKILLPFSAANQNLTPTISKPVRVLARYQVAQFLGYGDALLEEDGKLFFVMNVSSTGSGAGEFRTNAVLVREGTKTYTTAAGQKNTVEAFTSAALNPEETAVLNRVSAAFQRKSATLIREIANAKASQEFEDAKARASDTNPSLEYVLGKAYFEGAGTEKDERLGLEWLNRASDNGSGDARQYLEKLKGVGTSNR